MLNKCLACSNTISRRCHQTFSGHAAPESRQYLNTPENRAASHSVHTIWRRRVSFVTIYKQTDCGAPSCCAAPSPSEHHTLVFRRRALSNTLTPLCGSNSHSPRTLQVIGVPQHSPSTPK